MTPPIILSARVACNPELRHTRSLPGEPVFTAVAEKFIGLGLDPAAQQGESDVCAIKLFRSLRRRDVSAERIIRSFAQATHAARELSAARGYMMPFGKYRGKTVGEVPPRYLRWVLENCSNAPFNLRRAMQIVLNH
jgi:uncharacterized protein (DUF3820 family)